MKPKYYPHVTILGAISLTALPLCIVMSLSYFRSSSEFEQVIAGESHKLKQRQTVPTQDDMQLALGKTSNTTANAATNTAASPPVNDTRVAMLPSSTAESRTIDMTPTERRSEVRRTQNAAPAVHAVEQHDAMSDDSVSVPMPVVIKDVAPAAPAVAQAESVVADRDQRDPARVADLAALDAEMDTALHTRPDDKPSAYFDSTGHLAMIPVAPAVQADKSQSSTAKTSSKRRQTRSESTPPSTVVADRSMSDMGTSGAWPAEETDDSFGTRDELPLEDVILQQPLESRRVNRMENVVAVTRAKGWPIALVRSDLPDDFWWVQQMVGIRGNAFAARVNFGNEESIPGSVYQMVIVFLDSPDEVRRFRIAKRFKELPEGSRHSREFTFVRQ